MGGVKPLELINIKRRCTQSFPVLELITHQEGQGGKGGKV